MKLRRVLIIPDTHAPYHDRRAWALVLQVARAFGFSHILILGDFWDCYSVSDHNKDPNRLLLVDHELSTVHAMLDDLDKLGVKDKRYIEGNHEYRLSRIILEKVPALVNVVRVEKLLRLKQRGWAFTPYMRDTVIGKLFATHCIGNSSNASKAYNDYHTNNTTGHNHTVDYQIRGNALGEHHVSATFGWLGDVEQIDYMHRMKARKLWSLAFGIGYLEANGTIHLQPVPIINYSCVVEGRLFTQKELAA